jgi:hypothetical protein
MKKATNAFSLTFGRSQGLERKCIAGMKRGAPVLRKGGGGGL